ncbi:3-dehydroquinate synthase II [Streptomyces sp. NBC_01298]|uniref:3-dehydroquinate synthase II n=1 Tax=Streptomyces sp. NBC_01298 TaxID=2903817 RepID=UPI002E1095D5|nr:3-dehydroquinate synthase II [Streptomyces sp. NBC_01298]
MSNAGGAIPIWCDLSHLGESTHDRLTHVLQTPAEGVLLSPGQVPSAMLPERVRTAVLVQNPAELEGLDAQLPLTVISRDLDALGQLPAAWQRGLWIEVEDADSMNAAVAALGLVDVLVVSFSAETNIPLELIIAEAQHHKTTVVKRVRSLGDALVTRGVLQHGPEAMLLRVDSPGDVAALGNAFAAFHAEQVDLVAAEVTDVRSIGMGVRGCVDTADLFDPDEGMLVGSTSSGGLLVCAEVHYLPYMNLRPFRVNAGASHSYLWTPAGRTAYITDLRAGEPVLAVNTSGRARPVVVGRVKSEIRPLRLIECRIGDSTINTIVQDDWHVRLFDADGKVRNCTTIMPGDRMMAVAAKPGRHVGISVSETIVEV